MNSRLKIRLFAHSWRSDWNHGNAHFLRGLAHELVSAGHEVRCYEPADSWSYTHLLEEGTRGLDAIAQFGRMFSGLDVRTYPSSKFSDFAERELQESDVVVVHEWNSKEVVDTIIRLRDKHRFLALFHDTHHRAYTTPREIEALGVNRFDGILAFGEVIRQIYSENFGARRAWTFHEAADTAHFYPIESDEPDAVNWVGNWGDEERTRELNEFLIGPLNELRPARAAVYGVRYPESAQWQLQEAGIEYRGYLPNLCAPEIYSRSRLTLHIPRRCYANGLSGVPTIRMFEAMACGIPLVCSPWVDMEGLFNSKEDYMCVPDGSSMLAAIRHLLRDAQARQQLAASALKRIQQRHTCAHRAEQFMEICKELAS